MVKGVTAFVFAGVLAGALIAAPAQAGKDVFKVRVAKHKDGPYNVGATSHIDPGETKSFWFRVRNIGDQENLQLTFDDGGSSDGTGFKTKWFKAGNNVSNEVEGEGYELKIDPGQNKYFNAKQTGLEAPGAVEECLSGHANHEMTTYSTAVIAINGALCAL